MRPTEIVLIALSVLIVLLIGFGPLLGPDHSARTIRQECEMFYGPSGVAAVDHCVSEMTAPHGADLPEEPRTESAEPP